jgi:hypothetical protein
MFPHRLSQRLGRSAESRMARRTSWRTCWTSGYRAGATRGCRMDVDVPRSGSAVARAGIFERSASSHYSLITNSYYQWCLLFGRRGRCVTRSCAQLHCPRGCHPINIYGLVFTPRCLRGTTNIRIIIVNLTTASHLPYLATSSVSSALQPLWFSVGSFMSVLVMVLVLDHQRANRNTQEDATILPMRARKANLGASAPKSSRGLHGSASLPSRLMRLSYTTIIQKATPQHYYSSSCGLASARLATCRAPRLYDRQFRPNQNLRHHVPRTTRNTLYSATVARPP